MSKIIDKPIYKVYKHTSPSGKVYVGITSTSVERRWCKGNGYKRCKLFYRAIVKYGWNNIKHEIIADGLSAKEACALEIELIQHYKELGISYNASSGGETNQGYVATDKQREHARSIWKGKKIPRSIVEASIKTRTGVQCPLERRKLISQVLIEKYAKKVYKLDKLGNLLNVYNNAEEAAVDNNAQRHQIIQCCNKGALVFRDFYYLYEEEFLVQGITGRKLNQNRPIVMLKDGIELTKFNDVNHASKILGIPPNTIRDACLKCTKARGFNFRYLY